MGRWSEPSSGRVCHSQWVAKDAGANEILADEAPSGMMEERGTDAVVQDFQTGGSDPAKQVISGQVWGDETVPCWVVSIEVSKDKSVKGV